MRSFTSKQQQQQTDGTSDGGGGGDPSDPPHMVGLNAELLERLYRIKVPGDFDESLRRIFFKDDDRITTVKDTLGNRSCDLSSKRRNQPPDEGEREEEDAIHSGNSISWVDTDAA